MPNLNQEWMPCSPVTVDLPGPILYMPNSRLNQYSFVVAKQVNDPKTVIR